MAVVQNPFLSVKARGSVGGLTATRSGVGAVLKAKARPPKRTRPVQYLMRSIMGWCSRQYGSLTAGERDEWEAYAQNHPQPDGFGGTFILTPEQAYIMLNVVAVRRAGAPALQTSPPTDPPAASVITVTPSDGGASGEVILTLSMMGTGLAADFIDFQRAGPFQSPGRVEIHNRYRDMQIVAGTEGVYTYTGLLPEMYYWFRARYVDQYGQVTAWSPVQYLAPTI